MNLTYSNVIEKAKKAIPEFAIECAKEQEEGLLFPDSGVHIVFGYAFVPVLLESIKNKNIELTKKMFAFLEEMVTSSEKELAAVCDFSVLEAINGEVADDVLYAYMGKETRLDFDYMKKDLGYLA